MPVYAGNTTWRAVLSAAGVTTLANSAASALYSFTSHTFNNCTKTGRLGPSLADAQSAYSSAAWASNTSNLAVVDGIQRWTVPQTGAYRFTVAGARGGQGSDNYNGGSSAQGVPGQGAIITATTYLNIGDIIYILVGQIGTFTDTSVMSGSDTDGGGGGGTFVVKQAKSYDSDYYFNPDKCYVIPLIIAGGGGGGGSDGNGSNGSYNSYQGTSNWTDLGTGGASLGGGFASRVTDAMIPGKSIDANFTSGLTGPNGRKPGWNFLDGGMGGYGGYSTSATAGEGGFGGGGGATDEAGAGGGGWLGGLNGDNTANSSQGGSSYVHPTLTGHVTYDGYRNDMGYVTVTYLG